MLVQRDGAIECATPLACRWLEQHFGLQAGADRLPARVRRWLREQQRSPGQCRPLIDENEDDRLVLTLLHREADKHFAVLMAKNSVGSPLPRLRALGLTKRQAEVLTVLNKSNKEIAQHLGISTSTAKDHVHAVLRKLNVTSRAAAVARSNGPH